MSTALFFFSCNRVQQRLAPINCDSLSVVGLGVGLGLVANQKPEEVCNASRSRKFHLEQQSIKKPSSSELNCS